MFFCHIRSWLACFFDIALWLLPSESPSFIELALSVVPSLQDCVLYFFGVIGMFRFEFSVSS